jgi:hypothetical protein
MYITSAVRIASATRADRRAPEGPAKSGAETPHQAAGQALPKHAWTERTTDPLPLGGSGGSDDRSNHTDETQGLPANETSETNQREHRPPPPAIAQSAPNPKPSATRSGAPLAERSQGDRERGERRANQDGDGSTAEAREAAFAASALFSKATGETARTLPIPAAQELGAQKHASGGGLRLRDGRHGRVELGGWLRWKPGHRARLRPRASRADQAPLPGGWDEGGRDCDVRSHVVSDCVEGGSTNVEDVVRVSVRDLSLP